MWERTCNEAHWSGLTWAMGSQRFVMKLSLLLYTLDIFQRKKLRKENQPLWAYILATTALPGCVIKESYQTSLGLHVQSVNMKANSTCLVGLLGGLRGQPVLRTFENAGHTVSTKPSPPIFCIGVRVRVLHTHRPGWGTPQKPWVGGVL